MSIVRYTEIILWWKGIEFLPLKNINSFTINSIEMKRFEHFTLNSRMNSGNNSGIKIEITTGRSLGSIFLVTYLPTILINIINQATNYFDSDCFFEAIVTGNLTGMMVLSTLYISVSNSLPNTAYVKYVEIWLLGSLMYPFIIVIIHTRSMLVILLKCDL